MVCESTLPCKILITILLRFFTFIAILCHYEKYLIYIRFMLVRETMQITFTAHD